MEKNLGSEDLINSVRKGDFEGVKKCIDAGVSVDTFDPFNDVPIICLTGHCGNGTQIIKLLLDQGADPEIPDIEGYNALCWCIEDKNFDVAKILIENGADTSALFCNWGKSSNKTAEKLIEFFDLGPG